MAEDGTLGVYARVEGQEHLTSTPVMDVEDGGITKWHDTEWHDAKDTGKICAHMTVFQIEKENQQHHLCHTTAEVPRKPGEQQAYLPGWRTPCTVQATPSPTRVYSRLVGALPVGSRQMA